MERDEVGRVGEDEGVRVPVCAGRESVCMVPEGESERTER